ncbi:hypothetical protein AC1031_008056 [Aphanomyces cochlioides]|nr:hypothetical protein AC1031_008056 [Aphanomyces cochlioides]
MRFFGVVAAVAAYFGTVSAQSDYPLCPGIVPFSYTTAKTQYPELSNAIAKVSKNQIATWWTDNNANYYTEMQKLLNLCNETSIPTVIVYGLPNKDCAAGESNKGSNSDSATYLKFVKDLADLIGTRPVIYIMEPDALGLHIDSSCAKTNGYLDNMMSAIPLLTNDNANASLYVDIGYWAFNTTERTQLVVEAMKQLVSKGAAIRGISLDTSNYRKTDEMVALCQKFVTATKNSDYRCVIDTSRNYLGPKEGTAEWCNNRYAAIGVPPTNNTANDLIDYFLWLKTPGESDGTCNGAGISSDALKNGPAAGQFFEKAFSLMWDRGYYVDKKLGDKIGRYTLDVDQINEGGKTSWVAIGVVAAVCILLVVAGVLFKRRYDAKQGRSRAANRQVDAEAAVRKPYLSL